MLLCNAFGEVESGCRCAEMAIKILHLFQAREWIPRVYSASYGFCLMWKQPLNDQLNPLMAAYRIGLGTGDIEVRM